MGGSWSWSNCAPLCFLLGQGASTVPICVGSGDPEGLAATTIWRKLKKDRENSSLWASYGYYSFSASMEVGMDANVHTCLFVNL